MLIKCKLNCNCIVFVVQFTSYVLERSITMSKDKCIAMSVRVSKNELEIIKLASEYEKYSSYSEFVRRTVLIKACDIIKTHTPSKQ